MITTRREQNGGNNVANVRVPALGEDLTARRVFYAHPLRGFVDRIRHKLFPMAASPAGFPIRTLERLPMPVAETAYAATLGGSFVADTATAAVRHALTH